MEEMTSAEAAAKWGVSERTVRDYCAAGKIPGARLEGGRWRIPFEAVRPKRSNAKDRAPKTILEILRFERKARVGDRLYHWLQVDMTYSSNHIEGSTLTQDQTRYIFETNFVPAGADGMVNVSDLVETVNHFRCIDYAIDTAQKPLTEAIIRRFHLILKSGTRDAGEDWFAVGSYKRLANTVGGRKTTPPALVEKEIRALLAWYENLSAPTLQDLVEFHCRFERIHPFQDGNGRVGRLILLKECLRFDIVPFVIDEETQLYYYRGLQEWDRERGYLIDTCLTAQDKFRKVLDYFGISL